MEVSNEVEGEMEDVPMPSSTTSDSPPEEMEQPANKRVTRLSQRHARESSVDMLSEEKENASNLSQNIYRTPQSGTSSSSSVSMSTARTSGTQGGKEDAPPLDEQIATILRLAQVPPTDGMKGYIMSSPWLQDAQDRGTAANKSSKEAKEEVLPPVDNRDLILNIDGHLADLTDEKGDKFYPMKPGQELGKDIEILPEEAWEKIVKWHGMHSASPEVVRYCHNTSSGLGSENIQFELYPPVFTVLKLPWRPENLSIETLREKDLPPVKMVASRNEGYQHFLRRAKRAAKISAESRVRVWRIHGNVKTTSTQGGMPTPAQSRSNSPAPGFLPPLDLGDKFVLDVNAFTNLQLGSQRELIEVKDETNNPNYNGHANLDIVGIGQEGVIVLEEQVGGPAGGEFVSDNVKTDAAKYGLSKNALSASSASLKVKSATASGRTSPAPTGMMTRGRAQRSGRTRGVVGLGNLGNSCYMNSALQCVRSVKELTYYFLEGKYKEELNPRNPLSHNGDVAKVYAALLREIYNLNTTSSISPRQFKQTIGRYGPSFSGYGQQDSQEFLLFLLDGLQEDLNRIHQKPYIEKPDSTDEMVHDPEALKKMADRCWEIYKARNDSVITDLFAGMYKSTLHCPVCDKTSIIFDPFNNLTLQLPIGNTWSRRVTFYPLRSRPIEIDVDLDKTATWYQLKEYVATKMETDPKRLVTSEIYRHRFFKMFDDKNTLGEERLVEADAVTLFEVDQVPTNYPPPKKRIQKVRSLLNLNSDDEEESPEDADLAERLLVPIFNRVPRDSSSRFQQKTLFGAPTYITLTREEASDQDGIFRKVLGKVATLTTRDILRENQEQSDDGNEEEDVVVMSTEDTDSSSDSKINANSVQSEDGMVDISMQEAGDSASRVSYPPMQKISKSVPRVLRRGEFIDHDFRNLFDISILKSNEELVPTGWSSLNEESKKLPTLFSRLPKQSKKMASKRQKSAGEQLKSRLANNGSSDSSDEEMDDALATTQSTINHTESGANSSDEDIPRNGSTGSFSKGFSRFNRGTSRDGNGRLITYSRKGRRPKPLVAYDGTASEDERPKPKKALVRLGEGLVVEWNTHGYDALFGGTKYVEDDSFSNGTPTWDKVPLLPDPDLVKNRALRNAKRKNGVTLEECLNEFGKEEILSENDAWYCPRCKEHRRASKKFELWTVPDILIIHLKRFSSEGRFRDKVDAHVEFPVTDLDINERVLVHEEGKDLTYDLFAVDNHYGGLGGGHYTAFAKSFDDDQWYEYNDSMAHKRNNPQQVVSSAAYILFYRRRSSTALGGPTFEQMVREMESPDDTQSGSASQSRNESPSAGTSGAAAGEGQRLEDSSRGFSSASLEAGAARRAGNGGPQDQGAGITTRGGANDLEADEDEGLPGYSQDDPNPIQSMELDDDDSRPGLPFETTWEGFGNLGRGGVTTIDDDGRSITSLERGGIRGTPDDDNDNDSMVANHQDGEDLDLDEPWEGLGDEGAENDVVEINLDGKEE